MTELYYPFIWEELPHPASVEFSKLYYTYLMNTEYVESVTPTGREINNSYGSVRDYFSFFYSTSEISQRKCNKVILNKELANTILPQVEIPAAVAIIFPSAIPVLINLSG